MIVRYITITLILVLFSIGLQAQVSGFLGKRLMIKTDAVSWALGDPQASIEYTLNRKLTLELSASSITKFGSTDYRISRQGRRDILASSLYSDLSDLFQEQAYGNMKAIDLKAKYFFAGAMIAPYGFYFSGSVGYGIAEFDFYRMEFEEIGNSESFPVPYRYTIKNLSYPFLGAGMGAQYVIKKVVVIDLGVHYEVRRAFYPNFEGYIPDRPEFGGNLFYDGWYSSGDRLDISGMSGYVRLGIFIL